MEDVKNEIIVCYETKNRNFRMLLLREFQKPQTSSTDVRIFVYRNLCIYELFKELTSLNDQIFNDVNDPINLIEVTLFNYLMN